MRGWLSAPVIVLARTDSAEKVDALDAGADDYGPPFGMDEFLARLRAPPSAGARRPGD